METTVSLVKAAKLVYTVPTLVESIRLAHKAQLSTLQTKVVKPRKGDIVAFLDENGEILETATVAYKPGPTFARLVISGATQSFMFSLDKLTRVGQNEWKA